MLEKWLILIAGISFASGGVQILFPELKNYHYVLRTNVTTGTADGSSHWSLDGNLSILVYDNFTRVRFTLEDLNASIHSQNGGDITSNHEDAALYLKLPWEVDYRDDGLINAVYMGQEPIWSMNLKRGLSVNFQVNSQQGSFSQVEPCIYSSCMMMYSNKGGMLKKYMNAPGKPNQRSNIWSSMPWSTAYTRGTSLENTEVAVRIYDLTANGLNSLVLNSSIQYRIDNVILTVKSDLSLFYDSDTPAGSIDKLNVTRTGVEYQRDLKDSTDGIRTVLQSQLKNRTYELLLKIAVKGINADNIKRNGSYIHSLDFVELLDTVSKLSYFSLTKLFGDLVLGTSYDLETARNIFLEVLPHARSDACARFIKHLVIEEKKKLEDATILSMIRKLPYNVANLSQNLLEELETLTKLGLDFPQSIRHAGILSFAVLTSKTLEASKAKADYFDNIVVKYFRMYSDCPQYVDRMIWLQGLCSLGFTAESYIRTIYSDKMRNRHERLWASLACAQDTRGYMALESYLPILTDESENIQLRIAALHSILNADITATDFFFIHNFITGSSSNDLRRFWFSTVRSLENNKYFSEYKSASYYVPFISKLVKNTDATYWTTNNYIVSSDDDFGAWVQMMSVSGDPVPTFGGIRLSMPGVRPYQAAVYMVTEGVSSNIFRKMYRLNTKGVHVEAIIDVLEKMKMSLKTQEEVHIDVVIKIHDKTVYAAHVNQTTFESWNSHDMKKSIMEFLRFGSHINQQIVYIPVQLDDNQHSELGMPIRLQASVVSFTSVRGDLTATPNDEQDLDWENDLHIRYQGTAVTSLSTFAPLLRSEHVIRIQRSLVAHLPIKFNVTIQQADKSMGLTWLNPFSQRAGVALHSRIQTEVNTPTGHDRYTIPKHNEEVKNGMFFDCEQKMRFSEFAKNFLISTFVQYNVAPQLLSIYRNIEKFLSPSTCGVIIPSEPSHGDDEVTKMRFSVKSFFVNKIDDSESNYGSSFIFNSQVEGKDKDVAFKMDSSAELKDSGPKTTMDWKMYIAQSVLKDSYDKFLKICLSLTDVAHVTEDQEISPYPAPYEGHFVFTKSETGVFDECADDGNSSQLIVSYVGTPTVANDDLERSVEFHISQKLAVIEQSLPSGLTQMLPPKYINTTVIVKEKHGLASLSVDGGAETRFEIGNFGWLMDSMSFTQAMRKFGVYRECRIKGTTIHMLDGSIEEFQPQDRTTLILGDCSETPSFAILRDENGRLTIYDTKIKTMNETVKIDLAQKKKYLAKSGIIIYNLAGKTVVLLPSPFMPRACGACVK